MHNTCISFMRNSTRHQSSSASRRVLLLWTLHTAFRTESIDHQNIIVLTYDLPCHLYVEGAELLRLAGWLAGCLVLNWWAVACMQWQWGSGIMRLMCESGGASQTHKL